MAIAAVISYCTNDYRFLGKCLEEAKKVASQVVIPVCDHFFDGSPENRSLLEQTYAEHPDCTFVEFAYSQDRPYTWHHRLTQEELDKGLLWHQTARYVGFVHVDPTIEYVLFLDCDEILDGNLFSLWLATQEYKKWNAMRLLCYYYVLRATQRAKQLQELVLLAKKEALQSVPFFPAGERYALFSSVEGPKRRQVRGPLQRPLVHHYSWVRPPKESLKKAATWGHRTACSWQDVVEQAFQEKEWKEAIFGTDFEFEEISSPYFDPLAVSLPTSFAKGPFPHVHKVGPKEMLLRALPFS